MLILSQNSRFVKEAKKAIVGLIMSRFLCSQGHAGSIPVTRTNENDIPIRGCHFRLHDARRRTCRDREAISRSCAQSTIKHRDTSRSFRFNSCHPHQKSEFSNSDFSLLKIPETPVIMRDSGLLLLFSKSI